MRWSDIYIAGTGARFPKRVSVEAAIADGACDQREAARGQYLEVAVASADEASPDFAVAAARQALDRSHCAPAEVGTLLHAVTMHSGLDAWNSAAYVQRQVLTPECLVAEVRSGCDGALVALELACAYLTTHRDQPAAMITAADCWPEPVFDRWRGGGGVIFGDGGAAAVISRASGFARLVSMTTRTDPELEAMHRGEDTFWQLQPAAEQSLDLRRRTRDFFRAVMSKDEFLRRHNSLIRDVIGRITAEAGFGANEAEHLVLPFDGAETLHREYVEPFGLDIDRTTWQFDRRTGHFGAGDPFASLNHLLESGRLSPGDRILVISEGAGWSMTGAAFEVTHPAIQSPQP